MNQGAFKASTIVNPFTSMAEHPRMDNRKLFSQLSHCSLPFTTRPPSPTSCFDYNHLVSLLTQSQFQLDTVAEVLDCIISIKEQPNTSLLSVIKCNTKFDKEIVIREDDENAINTFRKMFDDMKERMVGDRVVVEEIALPLLRDGWRIIERIDEALVVDISPRRLLPLLDSSILSSEVCTVDKDTPTIIEQRHLSMTVTINNKTVTYSMYKVCPSSNNSDSPFHAHLWSKRDALLQEVILKQLVKEQMMEDRPMYSGGALTIMIAEQMLVQFSMVDTACEEGEGVLRDVRKYFINSKGQTCGWKECRQRLISDSSQQSVND